MLHVRTAGGTPQHGRAHQDRDAVGDGDEGNDDEDDDHDNCGNGTYIDGHADAAARSDDSQIVLLLVTPLNVVRRLGLFFSSLDDGDRASSGDHTASVSPPHPGPHSSGTDHPHERSEAWSNGTWHATNRARPLALSVAIPRWEITIPDFVDMPAPPSIAPNNSQAEQAGSSSPSSSPAPPLPPHQTPASSSSGRGQHSVPAAAAAMPTASSALPLPPPPPPPRPIRTQQAIAVRLTCERGAHLCTASLAARQLRDHRTVATSPTRPPNERGAEWNDDGGGGDGDGDGDADDCLSDQGR
jgi:hypothetical protein